MAVVTHTYTATLQTDPIMTNHSGVNFSRGRVEIGIGGAAGGLFSLTGTELIRLYVCKVPAGAVILDWWGVVNTISTRSGAATSVVLGLTDQNTSTDVTISHTLMAATTSISTSTVLERVRVMDNSGYMHQVSVSDDNANQYSWVTLVVTMNSFSSTASTTIMGDITVMYTMDNQASTSGLKTIV